MHDCFSRMPGNQPPVETRLYKARPQSTAIRTALSAIQETTQPQHSTFFNNTQLREICVDLDNHFGFYFCDTPTTLTIRMISSSTTHNGRSSPVKRLTACQQASRRLRKSYLKQIRNREYQKLRDIVPAVANKKKVSKITVIEEAVRYIDELHVALMSKLLAKGLNMTEVQLTLAHQLGQRMAAAHCQPVSPICQKSSSGKFPTLIRPPQP